MPLLLHHDIIIYFYNVYLKMYSRYRLKDDKRVVVILANNIIRLPMFLLFLL